MSWRIGCSGWSYPHWRDIFYPHGLRQADRFNHYSSVFDTVEINNSFYRTPSEELFGEWGRKAPAGFVYAVKVNRGITQYQKLGQGAHPLFEEFARRAGAMGQALGPLLVQLPPSLGEDVERLARFLSQPSASSHPLAFEFRHSSWFSEDVYRLLGEHGAALVISDLKELPVVAVASTSWSYVRFHGPGGQYWGSYSEEFLRDWAARLKDLCGDGYVYFNNDIGGAAPSDAVAFRELMRA